MASYFKHVAALACTSVLLLMLTASLVHGMSLPGVHSSYDAQTERLPQTHQETLHTEPHVYTRPDTIDTSRDFLRSLAPRTPDGHVQVVVEIPAGTNAKWEVEKESGHLAWERVEDSLRVVQYLPYPGNYGMVPRTWLPADQGGDDDPLDVILLGPQVERGSVVEARIVGVIRMIDRGEQDDKLIAVDVNHWFGTIQTLDQLHTDYPGVVSILTTWFESYKGPDVAVVQGVDDEEDARTTLNRAIQAYEERYEAGDME